MSSLYIESQKGDEDTVLIIMVDREYWRKTVVFRLIFLKNGQVQEKQWHIEMVNKPPVPQHWGNVGQYWFWKRDEH